MIDFTQETYLSLRQEMLDRVPDTYDKRDTAPIPTAISPAAYTLAGFYLTLDRVQRAAFVQTAVGDSLDMLAVIGGLTRYPASAAVRLGVFNTSVLNQLYRNGSNRYGEPVPAYRGDPRRHRKRVHRAHPADYRHSGADQCTDYGYPGAW